MTKVAPPINADCSEDDVGKLAHFKCGFLTEPLEKVGFKWAKDLKVKGRRKLKNSLLAQGGCGGLKQDPDSTNLKTKIYECEYTRIKDFCQIKCIRAEVKTVFIIMLRNDLPFSLSLL